MTIPDKAKILNELGGISEELYDELVIDFIKIVENFRPELKRAAAAPDFDKVRYVAHYLKGTSATLRLASISSLLQNMETAGREKNQEAVRSASAAFEKAFSEFSNKPC